jgi:hypothetical protein
MIILIILGIMLVCAVAFIAFILLSPPPRDQWEQEELEEQHRHEL